MEYEKIKQLMEDMGNSKLTSIEIDFSDGMKISMKKEEKQIVKTVSEEVSTLEGQEVSSVPVQTINVSNQVQTEVKADVQNCNIVKSPMVGTFYLKPSPTSNPYVKVGKRVKKGDILCIVEAMKLMNEIESEFDGEVIEILVKDGEPVEYGKPLFKIK